MPLMSLNPLAHKSENEKPQLQPLADFDERYPPSGDRRVRGGAGCGGER